MLTRDELIALKAEIDQLDQQLGIILEAFDKNNYIPKSFGQLNNQRLILTERIRKYIASIPTTAWGDKNLTTKEGECNRAADALEAKALAIPEDTIKCMQSIDLGFPYLKDIMHVVNTMLTLGHIDDAKKFQLLQSCETIHVSLADLYSAQSETQETQYFLETKMCKLDDIHIAVCSTVKDLNIFIHQITIQNPTDAMFYDPSFHELIVRLISNLWAFKDDCYKPAPHAPKELSATISALKTEALRLTNETERRIAVDVAKELQAYTNIFFNPIRRSGETSATDLAAFKKGFKQIVDEGGSTLKRDNFKYIILNIFIALTGFGLLAIGGYAAITYAMYKQPCLMFQPPKTVCQLEADKVKRSVRGLTAIRV